MCKGDDHPPGPAPTPAVKSTLPDIPEEPEEEEEGSSPPNEPEVINRDSTDHVLSDSLRRNSTTSEVWRDGVARASTPLEQTLEDQKEDDDEVFIPDDRRQKRKPTEAGAKPNWTPKRRVCEQCLKDQIFSDSEALEMTTTTPTETHGST